ncbi:tRNA (guanosine(37)-N1)-methyltransferase TrmD [Candidatus Kaiserbacteria bacterium RIFCSPLOWO2_01_FULL_53_17]|uniref:tRNA (guanine-N(1)-)-methyltransferase n=1 Tax=Candidatus Kaiserbacteria bacterium RIFCSPLOWO2_01_FULL_53_17 TaxID=1798511 RepID=A0A1F6EFR3_9BACT|nr:MAG: tRNA (guanosine(37)-N1)-methyltransferase TrmD [Candidatus Kaiserbacteria bacterium RIFCSPLOWO2_01_FULL_53_17]
MLHFHIVTLFPESIEAYFNASMLKRAQEDGKIKVSLYNPKDFTKDRKERVDRRPYGGGPGMVLAPELVLKAAEKALSKTGKQKTKNTDVTTLFFSPSGKQFNAKMAKSLSKKKHLVMIAGHYEGVDARVQKILKAKPISVGPYVLTGGELPAAIVVDAVSRHVKGVLGDIMSLEEKRVASPAVYTRPEVLMWKGKKYKVPDVLKSGHHAKIEEWKRGQRGTAGLTAASARHTVLCEPHALSRDAA